MLYVLLRHQPMRLPMATQYRVMRHNSRYKGSGRDLIVSSELDDRPLVQEELRAWLEQSRVIPSVRTPQTLAAACAAPSKVVFLLFGTPLIISDLVGQLRDAGKLPIANIVLLAGFARGTAA